MFYKTFQLSFVRFICLFAFLNASDPYCQNGEKRSHSTGFVCCSTSHGATYLSYCRNNLQLIWDINKNCLFHDAPCIINGLTMHYTDISDNDIGELNIDAVSNTNSKYSLAFGYNNSAEEIVLSGQCNIEINGNRITAGTSNTGSGKSYSSSQVLSATISSGLVASSIVNGLVEVMPASNKVKLAAKVFKNLVNAADGANGLFGAGQSPEEIASKQIDQLREELYGVIEDVFHQSWDCTTTYLTALTGKLVVDLFKSGVYTSTRDNYRLVDITFRDDLEASNSSLQLYETMNDSPNDCIGGVFIDMNNLVTTLFHDFTGLSDEVQRLTIPLIDLVMSQRIEIYSAYILSALDAGINRKLNNLPCSGRLYSSNNIIIEKYILNFNGAYNSILTDSKGLSYTDIALEINNLFNFADKFCQWVYVTYAFGKDIVDNTGANWDYIDEYCDETLCDCQLWETLSINKNDYDNDNDNLMSYFYERIDSQMTDHFMNRFNSVYNYGYTSTTRENIYDEFVPEIQNEDSDYKIIVFDENWDREWDTSGCRDKECGTSNSRKHWWENKYRDDNDLYGDSTFDKLKITYSNDETSSYIRVPFILSSDIEENVEHDDVIAYSHKISNSGVYDYLEISESVGKELQYGYCNDNLNSNIVGGRYLIEYDSSTAYSYKSRIIGFEVLCNENDNYYKDYGLYNFNNIHTLVGFNGEFIPVGSSTDTTSIEWSSWKICPKKHKLEISFRPVDEAHIKVECEKRCRCCDGRADGYEKADYRKLWWIASDPYVEYRCVPLSDDILKQNEIEIKQEDNNEYIGVYDKNNEYTDDEANEFCLNNFGTTLASIHNDEQNTNIFNVRINDFINTLIGGNDKDNDGTWIWRDGTSWDYEPNGMNWDNNNNNQECLVLLSLSFFTSNQWNDKNCDKTWNQFICNRYVYTPNPTASPTEYPTLSPTSYTGYILVDQDLRYDSAQAYCENVYGTSLATIQNVDENEIIYNMITESGYSESGVWIGCNDIDNEGTFIWEDGTGNGNSIDNIYTNWYPNNPDNGGTRNHNCCKMVSWTGTWDDDNCPESRWFVCNHPPKYIIIDIDLSYSDAESYCQTNYGTSLATINNDYENTKIHNMVIESGYSSSGLWIGINDIVSEGVFLWIDGILNDYTNWDVNEPYNQGRDDHNCGKMKTGNGKWDDDGCNERRWFICNLF